MTKLLILLAIAKGISLGVWWYLPNDGIELGIKENYQPKYQRVDFSNMLLKSGEKQKNGISQSGDLSISITNMVLKGLYGTQNMGYIIVALKSAPLNTSIVGILEEYQGYTLKSIEPSSAVFQKQGKEYLLHLEDMNKVFVTAKSDNEAAPNDVSRQDINYFAKNPADIWKDISIIELKDGDKIAGFKVTKINPQSKFASLGLQENDVIIKLNNVALESYQDAIDVYSNIDKLSTIQIVVLRENQEKELVYEIH
jgi:type II secretion system protein C